MKHTFRNRTIAGAVAITALAAAAGALASGGKINDPDHDVEGTPMGTPKAGYDILSATYGHSDAGALVHKVNVRKRFPAIDGKRVFPQININTDNNPNDCEYFVARLGSLPGTPTIVNCDTDAESHNVTIKRLDKNSVKFAFQPSEIGDPASYGWKAWYPGIDSAPDTGFQEHQLDA